jgi:hypothetical protein
MADLHSEVEALLERASNLDWLFFAGECERLMRHAGIDPNGCSLDDAWEAHQAGLTPAHFVYAVHGELALSFPTGHIGEGRASPPPRSSPLSAVDYAIPGPPFPWPPPLAPARPSHSQLAATGAAIFAGLMVGATVTALMLVQLPAPAPTMTAAAHASSEIVKPPAAVACPPAP